MESILTSIKKQLGIQEEQDHFDPELIIHINSVIMGLTQMGVGPTEGFFIEDDEATWDEFIPDNQFEAAKTYIYLKVRLLFDPPANATIIESLNRSINEFEWRLTANAERAKTEGEEEIQNG